MTVGELIEKLQGFDPSLAVVMGIHTEGIDRSISDVRPHKGGVELVEDCRVYPGATVICGDDCPNAG